MDSTQDLIDRLAIYLSAYKHYLGVKSKARLLDVAIFGESLARDLAAIVFGYGDLVDLNLKTSHPAIDLGSASAGCAIQVTLTARSDKIVETQRKFFEHGLDRTYSRLKFIILGEKQPAYKSQRIVRARGAFSFDPDKDVHDLGDLFNILVSMSEPAKIEAFYKRLEHALGSAIRPYLLGADRPGQHLRELFDAHDVRATDAVHALQPFGMTRAIYSSNTSLAETASRDLILFVAEQFGVSREWIEGTDSHIYSGGPGAEKGTDWRRSLRGAYDLVARARSDGERLSLILPTGSSLHELDITDDVVDPMASGYEHFFLVAQQTNDFSTDRLRMALSEPLRYRRCREGIVLLFLAAEIFEIETGMKTYIDIFETSRDEILGCYLGEKFLADLQCYGKLIGNHKDFVYSGGSSFLKATGEVPHRLVSLLKDNLNEFLTGRAAPPAGTIVFP